jgi:hypothetical protein
VAPCPCTGVGLTCFVVVIPETMSQFDRIAAGADRTNATSDFAGATYALIFFLDTAASVVGARTSGGGAARPLAVATPVQLTCLFDGANQQTFSNGTGAAPGTATGTFNFPDFFIGGVGGNATVAQSFRGDFYEAILFDVALNGVDRAAVQAYLKNKYNTP